MEKGIVMPGKERSRWPPLTRMLMAGEVSSDPPREMYFSEKVSVWYDLLSAEILLDNGAD